MVRIEADGPATVSTGSASRVIQTNSQTVSVPVHTSHEISLDDLIAQFKVEVPGFAEDFKQAAEELLPLAETADGQVTITSLRLAVGLTQKEFAAAIHWQQPNVSAMEAGQRCNPTRETMHMMCKVLGCDLNKLDLAIENSKRMYEAQIAKQEGIAREKAAANLKSAA